MLLIETGERLEEIERSKAAFLLTPAKILETKCSTNLFV